MAVRPGPSGRERGRTVPSGRERGRTVPSGRARGGRVRLTRRGRAVVSGLCLLLVLLVAAVVAPASQAAGPPREPEVAVVRPGDTLWSIAAEHAPSRDAPGVIEEIRRLNRLAGNTIHPGQRLVLPDLAQRP